MAVRIWAPSDTLKGYVTTYESIAGKSRSEIENRLGFTSGSLQSGYAIYTLAEPVAKGDFGWRDTTAYSAGMAVDPDTEQNGVVYQVPRLDTVRYNDAVRRGYGQSTTPGELDKISRDNDGAMARLLNDALRRLNFRTGNQRIVKISAAARPSGYPDSPYRDVPQWELLKPKRFNLLEVVPDEATAANLSGKAWWHANQAAFPTSTSTNDLAPGFREKVETFVKALRAAGAIVIINVTFRHKTRAHLMHYCSRLVKGTILAKDIPAIDQCPIVWDHGDETNSRAAAEEMRKLFNIVHQPALDTLHTPGLAIDMNISWTSTMKIVDGKGVTREIGAPANGASNAALHKVGATYGVNKLLSDAPHWSSTGH